MTIRVYWAWAKHAGPLTEHPAEELKAIPASTLIPKSELPEAANAILRVVRCEKDSCIRLCDEVLLALLIYVGLRAQATCDVQLRDLAGGTVTIRHGKGAAGAASSCMPIQSSCSVAT